MANKDIDIVVNALDFYLRIWIGQYGEIDRIRRFYDLDRADYVDFESCNKYYLAIRKILIPELGNENLSGSLGIWNEQTNHLAKSAYDMQQIIRYTYAWYVYPEGGITVNFNSPILEGDLPQIECCYQGDITDPVLTISGQESNYRLLLESLEVQSCLFRCKIKSLFEHYTDNPEALCIAKRLEEMYVEKIKETSVQLQDTLMKIEKLGQRIRALILKIG